MPRHSTLESSPKEKPTKVQSNPLASTTKSGYHVSVPAPQLSSTNEVTNPVLGGTSATALVPGPVWTSFESFRKQGPEALGSITPNSVGTLRNKAAVYRILLDSDFQRLVGLATDVCRLQSGLRIVIQAAKVAVKHPDQEHLQLLMSSASMIAGSPELPEREGHEGFRLTPEEASEASEDFDIDNVPRPRW